MRPPTIPAKSVRLENLQHRSMHHTTQYCRADGVSRYRTAQTMDYNLIGSWREWKSSVNRLLGPVISACQNVGTLRLIHYIPRRVMAVIQADVYWHLTINFFFSWGDSAHPGADIQAHYSLIFTWQSWIASVDIILLNDHWFNHTCFKAPNPGEKLSSL